MCDTDIYIYIYIYIHTQTHIPCHINSLIRVRLDRAGLLTLTVGGLILLQSGEILNPKYYSKFVSVLLRKFI